MRHLFVITLCLLSILCAASISEGAQITISEFGSLDPFWWPEPNKTASFTIKVKAPIDSYGGTLKVELKNVTNWLGECANYPALGSGNTDPDLIMQTYDDTYLPGGMRFDNPRIYSIPANRTNNEIIHTFPIIIRCYDYGAYGVLDAILNASDSGGGNSKEWMFHTIPFDTNANKIADSWESDSTIKHPFSIPDGAPGTTEAEKRQATVDKEPGPSDNDNDGDGFTVFEEYRGFMTTGTDPHTRPSPFVKNVFVACQGTTVSYGVGDANEMPDHTFTRVDLTYVNDPFSVISN